MTRWEIAERFNALYLGDSLLEHVELRIADAECLLTFSAGKVLKASRGNIFEPEAKYAPALLRFVGVRSISVDGGKYQLNSTVVDFGAAISGSGDQVEFYLDLTGGIDSDAFLVKVRIDAKDFVFGGLEV